MKSDFASMPGTGPHECFKVRRTPFRPSDRESPDSHAHEMPMRLRQTAFHWLAMGRGDSGDRPSLRADQSPPLLDFFVMHSSAGIGCLFFGLSNHPTLEFRHSLGCGVGAW